MYNIYSNDKHVDSISGAFPTAVCTKCIGIDSDCDHNMVCIWDASLANNCTGSELAAYLFKSLEIIGKFGLISLEDHQKHATLWSDGYIKTKTGNKLDSISGLLRTMSLNLRRLMLKALNSPNSVFTVKLTEYEH